MRLTQGAFSFLPDLTDEQIASQVRYALEKKWPVSLEYTSDPHPRNSYWEMYELPMFDVLDPATVIAAIERAVAEHPDEYVKLNAYDAKLGRQTTALSFIVHRPAVEPGFRLERTGGPDRQVRYAIHAYAVDRPEGERYRG